MKKLYYELKIVILNGYNIFFGILFPITMTQVFYSIFMPKVGPAKSEFGNTIFVTNAMIIPLSIILIGFAALFSQEVEKGITTRMTLFGYSSKKQLITKMMAQLIMLVVSTLLYSAFTLPFIQTTTPNVCGLLLLTLLYFVLSAEIFVLSYSVSLLVGRFGPVYAITMIIYFLNMFLSGGMGVAQNMFPEWVQYIIKLIPNAQLVKVAPEIWKGKIPNLVPLAQSYLFLLSIGGILMMAALYKTNQNKKTSGLHQAAAPTPFTK